ASRRHAPARCSPRSPRERVRSRLPACPGPPGGSARPPDRATRPFPARVRAVSGPRPRPWEGRERLRAPGRCSTASRWFERAAAMIESGTTLSFAAVTLPTVDKHSTGGVSDGVSLVFAPLAASLGLAVAKLSGRGLGHTGGTLDKLESIPGFRVALSPDELERQVEQVGCAVAAQSKDLVPADGALYALRDATATVASVPLIAASVMSKKLAVGTDLILLDVKAGSGAFMKTTQAAAELASACVRLANQYGRSARAAVTDMS